MAVVLGSGFAPAAAALGPADAEIPLADLGGFPPPTVAGHVAMARSLTIGGRRVLVYLGRVHLYEGNPPQAVAHGVRTAIAAGATVVVLTNAAGGINSSYRVGQPVLISDHLNLTGRSPLSGPPPPEGYPPRFADLTEVYSARLRALARASDPGLAEGVYAALPGPHYETPAEIRMLRTLGADLVGMSTVARGDRRPPPWRRGAGDLAGHQPRRRAGRPRAGPRRGHRGRRGGRGPDRRPARQHPAAGRARMSGTS